VEGLDTREGYRYPRLQAPPCYNCLESARAGEGMLKSLEIQNFKGIKKGKIDDLAQVNILVGRNNSGKSTILDALILVRSAIIGRDYLDRSGIDQIFRRRVDQGSNKPSYDELWYGMVTGDPLRFEVAFDAGAVLREEWLSTGNANVPNGTIELFRSSKDGPIHRWASRGEDNQARDYLNTGRWQEIKSLTDDQVATYLALVHILEPNLIHRSFNEGFWYELARDRKDKKVIEMLNDIYHTEIEGLSFSLFPPPQRRLVAALPETSLAVDWLGDGFRYAVNILSFGVVLQGTALLVEELETHQHPESLRKLVETLFELAKQQNLQLFLTTHSMELITYSLDAAEEKEIDLKLHHLRLDQEGTLTSTPFTRPNAELMLDIGHDPRLHEKYLPAR